MEPAADSPIPDNLGQIVTPTNAPPKEPDRKTRKEAAAAKATKPTSADHYRASVEKHRDSLDEERLRLLAENTRLHEKLEQSLPELATLRERVKNLEANTGLSVLRIGFGGALVSGATYAPNGVDAAIL